MYYSSSFVCFFFITSFLGGLCPGLSFIPHLQNIHSSNYLRKRGNLIRSRIGEEIRVNRLVIYASPNNNAYSEEKLNVIETYIPLEEGGSMQVLSAKPKSMMTPQKYPLLFIHGSFHAAWCWAENYMPYFANLGFEVVAISLRGTGGTPAQPGLNKVPIESHISDLNSFFKCQGWEENKPIVIAHSFGGILMMKYLERYPEKIHGLALVCSVPPSGNGKMTARFLFRSLIHSWKITTGFALKKVCTEASLCRELFFDSADESGSTENGLTNEDISRFQSYFERDSAATIDLVDLSKKLPSSSSVNGKATVIANKHFCGPRLVIGAKDDFIVDNEGLVESAQFLGLKEQDIVIVDSAHDIMLGKKWSNGAEAIGNWIKFFS